MRSPRASRSTLRSSISSRKRHRLLSRPAGSYSDKGDPYHCHCQKTSRLLSREARLEREAADHHLPVALRAGGMAGALHRQDSGAACGRRREADRDRQSGLRSECLETLEESPCRTAKIFLHHGGESFSHGALPERFAEGMRVITTIVLRELQGWIYVRSSSRWHRCKDSYGVIIKCIVDELASGNTTA